MSRVRTIVAVSLSVALLAATGCGRGTPGPVGPDRAPQEQAEPLSIAHASRICAAVEASDQVPVRCKVGYIDDVLSMMIALNDDAALEQTTAAVAEYVMAPFCAAANRSSRRATVYLIAGGALLGHYECETGEFTPDNATADNHGERDQQELVRALYNCQLLQESSAPLRCSVEKVDDTPAMIFAFANEDDAHEYQRVMVNEVASPFCDALTEAGSAGAVYQLVGGARARRFICSDRRWSEWMDVRKAPPAQPSRPTPSAPARNPQNGWTTVAVR